eukprot:GEMP01032494.1.p1 GENE.GEMP01032494.1~~GEMP01032494.1.p1  ORF type:complete len:302 (+),score=30.02 GEMP01032494.1:49-954(+)
MTVSPRSLRHNCKKYWHFAYTNVYDAIRDRLTRGRVVAVCALTVTFLCIKFFGTASMFMTLSLAILLMALVNLASHIRRTQSVQGVSIKMIKMQMLSSATRLCTTTWLNGYIPDDWTGDGPYQILDFSIIVACLVILHCAYYRFPSTHDAQIDCFHLSATVVLCFIAAALSHSSLNGRPFFDALWTASLYLDTMSGLPQSLLLVKSTKRIPFFAGVYVSALFLSRAMSLIFWFFIYKELNRPDCFIFAGELVVISHLVAFSLVTDFLWKFGSDLIGSLSGRNGNRRRHFDFSDFSECDSLV